MKSIYLSLLGALGLCLISFTPADAIKVHEFAPFHEVEFPDGDAYDCHFEHGCWACKNTSGRPAITVVAHTHKFPPVATTAEEEFHCIYPNQTVFVCGPTVVIPAPGTKVADETRPQDCPAR